MSSDSQASFIDYFFCTEHTSNFKFDDRLS